MRPCLMKFVKATRLPVLKQKTPAGEFTFSLLTPIRWPEFGMLFHAQFTVSVSLIASRRAAVMVAAGYAGTKLLPVPNDVSYRKLEPRR